MGKKKRWQIFRDSKRLPAFQQLKNKKMEERLVPKRAKPTDVLMADIRRGAEPFVLIEHIGEIAERGSELHIKYFQILLKHYPERKQYPYPDYEKVREALLDAIEKLQKKYKTK